MRGYWTSNYAQLIEAESNAGDEKLDVAVVYITSFRVSIFLLGKNLASE